MKPTTYREAGVDIDKGNRSLKDVKDLIQSTYSKNVLTELGSFGGMYRLGDADDSPVLVASADGVGTKLKVAFAVDKHDTVGQDLVNHCVNDIAVGGAIPLFFLDYFATDSLNETVFADVIAGFVKACRENNCALIGGETAEMPDMYKSGEYDISGTIVGQVDPKNIVNGSAIKEGDQLIGIESNGLHTNGYSLARKVLFSEFKPLQYVDEIENTVGEELLRVHRSYLPLIQKIISKTDIHGISHITGGGIAGNTNRLLKPGFALDIDWQAWERLPIFNLIQNVGKIPEEDMRRAFNLGIGLVVVVNKNNVELVIAEAENMQLKAGVIGQVTAS